MDLTDVTITPMIAVGTLTTPMLVFFLTGWSPLTCIVIGVIAGPILGFFAGFLLFCLIHSIAERVMDTKK